MLAEACTTACSLSLKGSCDIFLFWLCKLYDKFFRMRVNSYLIYQSASHTYERLVFDAQRKLEILIKLYANFCFIL